MNILSPSGKTSGSGHFWSYHKGLQRRTNGVVDPAWQVTGISLQDLKPRPPSVQRLSQSTCERRRSHLCPSPGMQGSQSGLNPTTHRHMFLTDSTYLPSLSSIMPKNQNLSSGTWTTRSEPSKYKKLPPPSTRKPWPTFGVPSKPPLITPTYSMFSNSKLSSSCSPTSLTHKYQSGNSSSNNLSLTTNIRRESDAGNAKQILKSVSSQTRTFYQGMKMDNVLDTYLETSRGRLFLNTQKGKKKKRKRKKRKLKKKSTRKNLHKTFDSFNAWPDEEIKYPLLAMQLKAQRAKQGGLLGKIGLQPPRSHPQSNQHPVQSKRGKYGKRKGRRHLKKLRIVGKALQICPEEQRKETNQDDD